MVLAAGRCKAGLAAVERMRPAERGAALTTVFNIGWRVMDLKLDVGFDKSMKSLGVLILVSRIA